MTPETLAALHARVFIDAPPPWPAAAFAALLGEPGVFLVPRAAGFAIGRAAAGEAELLTLAVAPEARRRGEGLALLAAFEATARDLGAEEAFLEVAEDNVAAEALYRAADWVAVGRRPRYYAGRLAAVIMRKSLAPEAGKTD